MHKDAHIAFKTEDQGEDKHHFFGYHDICPWSADGKYLLALETGFIDRPPRGADPWGKRKADVAWICVIDIENNESHVVSETRAWNFQQGCRVQWLPGEGNENKIIYNDRKDDGKFISVIFNVKTKEKNELNYPIYAISPSGDFGIGLDFAWLSNMHGGYGYAVAGGESEPPPSYQGGITRVDLKTGKEKIIIHGKEGHALEHVAFSPNGMRMCFLDKSRLPDGGFLQQLVTVNYDGSDSYILPGHVTHFCWKSNEEILAYGKWSPGVMALRAAGISRMNILKPFLNIARKMRGALKQKIAGQSYFVLRDKTQDVKRIAVGVMTEDGHPQFSPNGEWVVTDTYADEKHERKLILYNWSKSRKIDVGKFYALPKNAPSSWEDSEMRSDLHPRWNRDGTQICIDSVHEGSRQMYVLDVKKIVAR